MNLKCTAFLVVTGCLTGWLMTAAAGQSEEGEAVFKAKCAMCHGADGKGDTKAGKMVKTPDLTQKPWKSGGSLEATRKVILEGAGKMPGSRGKLTDAQIDAVARHSLRFADPDSK